MERRRNQIFLGVIILVLGIFMLVGPRSSLLNFGAVAVAACGLAFLLLYRTKRKSWSLVLGGYLAYFGGMYCLEPILRRVGLYYMFGTLFAAMFFIVPAVIFFVLYFDKNKRGLLFPASFLFWFGAYLFLAAFTSRSGAPFFFAAMGCACVTPYICGKGQVGKWTLYTALALFVFAALGFFKITFAALGFPKIVALCLIICAVVIILKNIRKNQ